MDKWDPTRLKEFVFSLSKGIIEKYYPEEVGYFAPIWSAMKGIISEITETGPDKWRVVDTDNKLLTSLGFSDKYKVPDLASPIIIGVLTASLWHLGIIGNVPKKEEMENIIGAYCERFKATKKSEKILKESLSESNLVTLLKENIIKDTEFRIAEGREAEYKEEKKYIIYSHENEKGYQITESEYQALMETDKHEYLIWMDEIKKIFLINNHKCAIGSKSNEVLKHLIRKSGDIADYNELFEEYCDVAKDPKVYLKNEDWNKSFNIYPYRWISEIHRETEGKLKSFIVRIRNRGYRIAIENEEAKYCLIDYLKK